MTAMEQKLEQIRDNILLDHRKGRPIDTPDLSRYPDKTTVIGLVEKLLGLVFPGFAYNRTGRSYHDGHSLYLRIEDVLFDLREQIKLALRGTMEEQEAQDRAQAISLEFLERIPQLRSVVQTDVEAAFDGDPAASGADEIILCYPGLFAVTVYRLAHILYELQVPMLPRIMTEHAHSVTGIDIHPGATIGDYFFIDHGTGIVIGQTTIIGQRVKIYQGVTLGGLSTRGGQSLRGTKRHPTIEDNVTIYANATILGGETVIGHDSVIGGSAFVTHSIPPCTTVSIKSQELQFKTRNCENCPGLI